MTYQNRFDFELPVSKKIVTFRLTTHGDEMQANAAAKSRKGKNKFGERTQTQITARLKQQIIAVDGDDDKNLIDSFVDTMLSRESLALRNYIKDITPDLDMDIYFECDHCSYEADIPFPLTSDFFWPRV